MFTDRTSAATIRANQLHLWLSSMAYFLLRALRRIDLQHTRCAKVSCGSIRLALLKIGAVITAYAASRSPWLPAALISANSERPTPCLHRPAADETDSTQPIPLE
jgi:hypothetical protein